VVARSRAISIARHCAGVVATVALARIQTLAGVQFVWRLVAGIWLGRIWVNEGRGICRAVHSRKLRRVNVKSRHTLKRPVLNALCRSSTEVTQIAEHVDFAAAQMPTCDAGIVHPRDAIATSFPQSPITIVGASGIQWLFDC